MITQRDRHEIGEKGRPQADRDRYRQLVANEAHDAPVLEEAVAEIEHQVVLHHQLEAFERRLVETVLVDKLTDQRRIDPAGAPVKRIAAVLLWRRLVLPAADALGRAHGVALELGDHCLHRAARRRLHDDEIEHHDREQRRDHQQDATDRIGDHFCGSSCFCGSSFFFASTLCSAVWSIHQLVSPGEYLGGVSGRRNLSQ
jgi:hypothetical protein